MMSLLTAWQEFNDVAMEVETPQSVDVLFNAELIAETECATVAALDFAIIAKDQRTLDHSF